MAEYSDPADNSWDVLNDPDKADLFQALSDEVREEVEKLSRRLRDTLSQRDSLRNKIDHLKETIIHERSEKRDMLKQVRPRSPAPSFPPPSLYIYNMYIYILFMHVAYFTVLNLSLNWPSGTARRPSAERQRRTFS